MDNATGDFAWCQLLGRGIYFGKIKNKSAFPIIIQNPYIADNKKTRNCDINGHSTNLVFSSL